MSFLRCTMSVECVLKNVAQTVGEGPHWDQNTSTLLHVDILAGDVFRWNSETGENEKIHFDETVSLVVPCTSGGYIITLGRTLAHLDWDTKTVTRLHEGDKGTKNRFNDGKCDRKGRLWAGTMGQWKGSKEIEMGTSHLYSMDLDGSFHEHLDGVSLSNGMAWSPDNSIMYYIDTVTRKIDAFDYNLENGTISNRRVVVDYTDHSIDEYGYPDGMTIDVEGKLWVACPRSSPGKVKQFDPETGKEIMSIDFPTKTPTSCCFGGKNLDELYVTSLRSGADDVELAKYPLTGSLFKVTGLGIKGFPADNYEGKLDLKKFIEPNL